MALPPSGRLAVARQLEVDIGRDRRRTAVGNFVLDADQVAAATENIGLGDLDAIAARGFEAHAQFVLAVLQLEAGRRQGPAGAMIGQVRPDQPALCGIGMLVVEQHEIVLGVFGGAVLEQLEANDVATQRRDIDAVKIGLDRGPRGRRVGRGGRHCCGGALRGRHGHSGSRGCRHFSGSRSSRSRCGGARRRRMALLDPGIPKHDQGKAENEEQDQALIVHDRSREEGLTFREPDHTRPDATGGNDRRAGWPATGP